MLGIQVFVKEKIRIKEKILRANSLAEDGGLHVSEAK